MDEDLAAAARAFEAAPTDVAAARAYEDELRQAGRDSEVANRYRVAMLCDRNWNQLSEDVFHHQDDVRFCTGCRRRVFRVRTPEEFAARVGAGECVMATIKKLPDELGRYYGLVTDLPSGFVPEAGKKRDYMEAPEVQARRLPCVIEMSAEQIRSARSGHQLDGGFEMLGRVGVEKHT